jgi:hypothetical protein
MSKLGEQLSEAERADIATIMRQSQCYDAQHVLRVYKDNKCDVVESICALMALPERVQHKTDDNSSPFTEIREIMKEKYDIYYQRSANIRPS